MTQPMKWGRPLMPDTHLQWCQQSNLKQMADQQGRSMQQELQGVAVP
jgi:hypothetical protein